MIIKEIRDKETMLKHFDLLLEVYPNLQLTDYDSELDTMLKNDYFQIAVYENGQCIGLTGIWIGSKLWCGKYLECDNVVISSKHRSKGIGKLLFDHVEVIAKKEGVSMMALDSYSTNFKAHKFFYNQGFEPRGFHFINILDKSKIR